jgi:hypothetical protein
MNRPVEIPEQPVARELSSRHFEVVFLPHCSPANDAARTLDETEIMRHLIC